MTMNCWNQGFMNKANQVLIFIAVMTSNKTMVLDHFTENLNSKQWDEDLNKR
jgi:hypothetical protein